MAVILVVEDDPSAQLLTKVKLKNHFTVVCANDGEEALTIMERQRVDLIVADIMMPNMDGYQLVQSLREVKEEVPIILVTARADFEDKRRGFALGADDYMVKPINYEELLWRIEALLRRAKIASEQRIVIGESILDAKSYQMIHDGKDMALSKKEFELLYKLLSYPNVILTKNQLLEEVWGYDSDSDENTIKTHINRLRNKLKNVDDFAIITAKGLGYKAEVSKDNGCPSH